MAKFNWKDTLKTVAPTIATALGGPLAGVAVKALGDKILGKGEGDTTTEEEISNAIMGGDPETLLKAKQAEEQFKLEMEKLGIEREKLVYEDIASARQREMAVKDNMPLILGLGAVVAFALYVCIVSFVSPDLVDHHGQFVFYILGVMSGIVGQVYLLLWIF